MPEAFALGPLLVPTLRAAIVGALLLGILAAGLLARLAALDRAWVRRVADASVLLGLAGARLGFVATHWPAYAGEPWSALYLWQPGYSPLAGVGAGLAWALWRLARSAPGGQRWPYAQPLLAGSALAGTLVAGVVLALQLAPAPGVLRAASQVPGPALQALLPGAVTARADRVPEFEMQDLDGAPVAFSSLAGRVVVLNFWASWCAPCRREMPMLDRFHADYAARGVSVLGIDLSEPPERVRAFVAGTGVGYPIWVDPPGRGVSGELYARLDAVGLPSTYFIDARGEIRDLHVGELSRGLLVARVDALLAASTGAPGSAPHAHDPGQAPHAH